MNRKSHLAKRAGIALAVLAAILAVGPLLVPYQSIAGAVAPQELADGDSQFVAVNGVTLHYKQYGRGKPTFILLHGTLANTYSWHQVVEPLAQQGTVIVYDRPPFGLASRPMPGEWEGESPYSYESQTDLLVGLMDELGIPQVILVGNSMGGAIAMLTAQRYPDRIQALVLVDPAQTGHGFPGAARWLFATPQMRRLGPLFLQTQLESFGLDIYARSWHDPSQIQEEDKNAYMTLLHIQKWDRGLWELFVAARPFETILNPQTITVPVLVITGDDDRVVGTAANVALSKKLPDAQLAVLAECGHVPQEECPASFTSAVNPWLAQHKKFLP